MNETLLKALKVTLIKNKDLSNFFETNLHSQIDIDFNIYIEKLFDDFKDLFITMKIEEFPDFIKSKIIIDRDLHDSSNNNLELNDITTTEESDSLSLKNNSSDNLEEIINENLNNKSKTISESNIKDTTEHKPKNKSELTSKNCSEVQSKVTESNKQKDNNKDKSKPASNSKSKNNSIIKLDYKLEDKSFESNTDSKKVDNDIKNKKSLTSNSSNTIQTMQFEELLEMTMKEDIILISIKNEIIKDTELIEFYNKNLSSYTEDTFDIYLEKLYHNYKNDLSIIKINDFREFILSRIRNTKKRYRKVQNFEGRLIDFPLLLTKRMDYVKAAFDNELLKAIIIIVANIYKEKETIVRPASLQGLFTATEQISLFNMSSLTTIENDSVFLSDKEFTRQKAVMQPFILSNTSNLEVVYVGANQTAYAKSKTLDKRDQKIMDFFVNQYKKTMYYDSGSEAMLFPLSTISSIAYGKTYGKNNQKFMEYTEKRLEKMSCQGFKERKLDAEDINDYNIIRLFEVQFITKNSVRYAAIDLSGSLKRDIKNNNFLELYSDKMSEIKNDFTSIFTEFLANQRVSIIVQGNTNREMEYPYEGIKTSVRLPYLKSKPKNIEAIKFSLEELKSINFIVENYKVTKNYIYIKFLPLDYFELKALNLKDKAKELEISPIL